MPHGETRSGELGVGAANPQDLNPPAGPGLSQGGGFSGSMPQYSLRHSSLMLLSTRSSLRLSARDSRAKCSTSSSMSLPFAAASGPRPPSGWGYVMRGWLGQSFEVAELGGVLGLAYSLGGTT